MIAELEVYLTLFMVSFLAATFLPAYSEVMFAGLLATGYEPAWLWTWATAGNISSGSITCAATSARPRRRSPA